jgi:ubiquitin carboxyl-terminal hydrolase 14
MFKLNVKWGKQTFSDVECDTNGDVETFRAILYALSNVPVDKQKIMVKGKIVKDGDGLAKLGLKEGMTIMMVGTAEEKGLVEPKEKIKFIEDMTPEERAIAMNEKAAIVMPAGLENLGNTCYMNSTVQCLSRVKELKHALKTMPAPIDQMGAQGGLDGNTALALAGGQMMNDLEVKGFSYPPIGFVQRLREVYPIFNETDQQGRHKQQDADECYQSILQAWR